MNNNDGSLKWVYGYDKQIFNNIINNKIISIKIINMAAFDGNLEIIKWTRENGSCWDEYTLKNTAWYDHFDCFQYLWLNNCYIDALTKLSEITIRHHGRMISYNDEEFRTYHCKDEITYIAKTKHNYDTALNWITMQIYLSNNNIVGFDVRITEFGSCTFCIMFCRIFRLKYNS